MATKFSLMHSVNLMLMSTGVLFIALVFSFSLPHMFSSAPDLWSRFSGWLKPPYLYLLINGIIITIAASSRLHQKDVEHSSPSPYGIQHHHDAHPARVHLKEVPIPAPIPASIPPIPANQHLHHHEHHFHAPSPVMPERVVMSSKRTEHYESPNGYDQYGTGVINRVEDETVPRFGVIHENEVLKEVDANYSRKVSFGKTRELGSKARELKGGGVLNGTEGSLFGGAMESVKKTEYQEPISKWTPPERQDSISELLAKVAERPPIPATVRFGHHRRPLKAGLEGGKALRRVTKPKKQETLESTWKAITEGRHMPLNRHLMTKKSTDTWDQNQLLDQQPSLTSATSPRRVPHPDEHFKKCETFQDRTNYDSPSAAIPLLTPSKTTKAGGGGASSGRRGIGKGSAAGGGIKLKKEPSLGQDELNRRVEAFINKFNEDMRLQRQESIQQFTERINRAV